MDEERSTAPDSAVPDGPPKLGFVQDLSYGDLAKENSFRLFYFEEAKAEDGAEDEIHCQIVFTDLDNHPPYVGLSYTWGNPGDVFESMTREASEPKPALSYPHVITVGGQAFRVSQALYDVLLRLRHRLFSHKLKYAWIDALCIDQGSIDDRSTQVGLMDQIYSQALMVFIWLGEAPDKDSKALERLLMYLSRPQLFAKAQSVQTPESFFLPFTGFDDENYFTALGLSEVSLDEWQLLTSFFCRGWFTRAWIIQEYALAQNAFFMLGSTLYLSDWLVATQSLLQCTNLTNHLLRLTPIADSNLMQDEGLLFSKIGGPIKMMDRVQQLCRQPHNSGDSLRGYAEASCGFLSPNENAATVLMSLLAMTRVCKCEDSRDKVYALYGLVAKAARTHGFEMFTWRPNYHKSTAEVYTDAAESILGSSRRLGLLGFMPDTALKKLDGLPSWVPDFSSSSGNPFFYKHPASENFNASQDAADAEHPGFSILNHELSLKVFHLATVHELGNSSRELYLSGSFSKSAQVTLSLGPTYKWTGQPGAEALWRTLTADVDDFSHPAPANLAQSFRYFLIRCLLNTLTRNPSGISELAPKLSELARTDSTGLIPTIAQVLRSFPMLREVNRESRPFEQASYIAMHHRRLFTTSAGHLGLGPNSMRIGDQIVIAKGGALPLVIREVPTEESPEEGQPEESNPGGSSPEGSHSVEGLPHGAPDGHPENLPEESHSPKSRPKYTLIGEAYVHGIMHGEARPDSGFEWTDIDIV